LAQFDAYDETRRDFSRWKGIYETWRRRKAAYEAQKQRVDENCGLCCAIYVIHRCAFTSTGSVQATELRAGAGVEDESCR